NHNSERNNPGQQELGHEAGPLSAERNTSCLQLGDEFRVLHTNCTKEEWLGRIDGLRRSAIGSTNGRRSGRDLGDDFTLNVIFTDQAFGDFVVGKVILKLAIRDVAVGELRHATLPYPEQQKHDGQIPKRRTPLGGPGAKLPFRVWLTLVHGFRSRRTRTAVYK